MKTLAALFVACVAILPGSALADGADLYAKNCASCHGADAKADTPAAAAMKVPPIAGHDAAATVEFVEGSARHKAPAAKLGGEDLEAIGAYLAGL